MNSIAFLVIGLLIAVSVSWALVYKHREDPPEKQTAHAVSLIAFFLVLSTLVGGLVLLVQYVPN